MRDAVIVSTARTPIGRAYRCAFNAVPSPMLAAHAIRAAVERTKVAPASIDSLVQTYPRRVDQDPGVVRLHPDAQGVTLVKDEGNRPKTTLDGLRNLKTVRKAAGLFEVF